MRILVADDEHKLLEAYRNCLEPDEHGDAALDALGDQLFGSSGSAEDAQGTDTKFRVDYVDQGQAAIDAVRLAIAQGDPYGVLFLDMRMPPGIDGRETAKQVRSHDANINIVVVTGYSDHSQVDVSRVAGPQDKLYYLAKPFEMDEITTLAHSLSSKWSMEAALKLAHQEIADKMAALEAAHIELAASESKCRHIALHDQLTRLPNRLSFQETLSTALANRQQEVAVLFVDLDRFKLVNDTLGHAAGDELVRRLSENMARSLDGQGIIARLGGDEFGIILQAEAAQRAEAIGAELGALCAQQFELLGSQVHVSASIGIAQRGHSNVDGSELLRRADLALYSAKQGGRNCCRMFEPHLDESSRKRADVDARLRIAMNNEELVLFYQPIVDPHSSQAIGYEALLRWDDPEHGLISPAIFVPIAEETGLIMQLGEWVVRRAFSDAAKWPDGIVSINLSTRHFQSPTLPDFIKDEAEIANLPLSRIQLEITETALFDDPALAASILLRLRALGVRIALDDFGTGYSSLVNLKDFEIDCIKIDQSFVATLGKDRQASAIVNSVTGLARSLGLKVVAEGVESEMQVQALRMIGCELMQGYFYSPAVGVEFLPVENMRESGQMNFELRAAKN